MKVLVTLKMNEIVAKMSLQPLAQSRKVDKIYVVRDWPGPMLPKVEYICPPRWLTKSDVAKTVAKLILMLWVMLKEDINIIAPYYILPHGINGFICGKLLNKPIIFSLMGGSGEIKKTGVLKRFVKKILKKFDVVTATGETSKKYLLKLGLDPGKIFILPDSIDIQRFYPTSIPKKYDIISIGRLSPGKNIETLLKAILIVKKIKKNLTVGIVGDGPSMDSLVKLTKELGIIDNVEFLGFKDNPEFYYNSGKIYVLTSFSEGLPMAMLEAMACGLPGVGSNVGDVLDIAKDGENAIVIDDPHDVDGFAKAIIRLLNDNELYKKLSENTKIVREKYCYESATKVWNEILDTIGG